MPVLWPTSPQEHAAEVSALGTFGTRQGDRDTLVRKRQAQAKPLGFVSAAGPGGDGLSRALTNKAAVCWVGAPSLRPTQAGARLPPDRRDARPLARRMRSGALPPGYGPAVDEATMRALRAAAREPLARSGPLASRPPALAQRGRVAHPGAADGRAGRRPARALRAATLRRNAFVLRHDSRSPGRAPWRLWAMATQVPLPPQASRWRRVQAKALQDCHVSRQRRRPGVGSPSAA